MLLGIRGLSNEQMNEQVGLAWSKQRLDWPAVSHESRKAASLALLMPWPRTLTLVVRKPELEGPSPSGGGGKGEERTVSPLKPQELTP